MNETMTTLKENPNREQVIAAGLREWESSAECGKMATAVSWINGELLRAGFVQLRDDEAVQLPIRHPAVRQ